MAISKKNKRKIVYQNQTFYWWVREAFDGYKGMLELNISSEDKKFLIKYFAIQNQDTNRYLIVVGSEFPGLERKNGNWQRFICPDFIPASQNHVIQPSHIKSIFEWCFDSDKELIPVNYKGEKLE